MNNKYRIQITKEQLTFSAAHFITFGDNICERLHGHNYGVRCEITGELNEHGYVVDFIAIRDALAEETRKLDHHVLLPTEHSKIQLHHERHEITAVFEKRRWVFPVDDCVLLPIENTTAELIATYLANKLLERRSSWSTPFVRCLIVAVDENQGQWGEVVMPLSPDSSAGQS